MPHVLDVLDSNPSWNRLASTAYFAKPATLREVQFTVNHYKIQN